MIETVILAVIKTYKFTYSIKISLSLLMILFFAPFYCKVVPSKFKLRPLKLCMTSTVEIKNQGIHLKNGINKQVIVLAGFYGTLLIFMKIKGATSVGKSAVAKELCNMCNAEIVIADSVQIYKYLNIGSNKPTLGKKFLQ